GRVHAAGVDYDLGFDVPALGLDATDTAVVGFDGGDAHALADLAAAAPRSLCQRQRQPARIEIAVTGDQGGTDHAVPTHQRKAPLRLLGADELEGQTEARPPAGLAFQFFHPLG